MSDLRKGIIVLLLQCSIMPTNLNNYEITFNPLPVSEKYESYPKGSITPQKIKSREIPKDYILAMIAIHECINLCPQDSKYIIEASLNREEVNWGGYGDIYNQILSPEFKGLIDKNFYFNPKNKRHLMALYQARRVLSGERELEKRIFGWISHKDTNLKFIELVKNHIIVTPTWHKFWLWPKQKKKQRIGNLP